MQQGVIWAKFCALYLPATVDRFLDLPVPNNESTEMVEELQLNNAYLEMLSAVQNTPYFSKYLRSQSLIAMGGKRLPQVIGQRLVALGPTWDGHLQNPPTNRIPEYFALLTASVLRLFCNLLAAFIKEEDQTQVISSRTSGQLRPMLRSWALRYPNTCLGEVSMRALGVLSGNPEYLRDVNRFVRRDVKNWKVCAMPKCKVSVDLKACGRCVVRFVVLISTDLDLEGLLRCQTVHYVCSFFFNG